MSRPARPGPWPPAPSQPQSQSQPQPLSWAKRTAFKNAPISNSGQISTPNATPVAPDLESGPTTTSNVALPTPPANPPASATANQNTSANRVNGGVNGASKERIPSARQRQRDLSAPLPRLREREVEEEPDDLPQRQPHVVKYQLRDTPGLCESLVCSLSFFLK
jgi:hypothetical protein